MKEGRLSRSQLAGRLDHSLLKPTLTEREMVEGCLEAVELSVASVCIVPSGLRLAVEQLRGSKVAPSTTVGFPHGVHTLLTKRREAEEALSLGATELDMVVNVGKVLAGDYAYVEEEVASVLAATHAAGAKLKVIFENAYLRDSHKRRLCGLCSELGVDWVKTSTGFGPAGATSADVQLMREACPPSVQVKAAGGIRTAEQALELCRLGASRIGTSASRALLAEASPA